MTGPISLGNDRSIGSGATETQLDIHAGKVDIRMIPENAVGNDISKCVNIRDTGTGELYPIATATPPQEFDLPLAEDITALQPCTYWKNQFGEVTIGGCAANGISDNITIATLPAGFRPAKAVERPATLSGGGERYAGSVLIGTDGAIRIRTPATTNAVVFGATFIAEN